MIEVDEAPLRAILLKFTYRPGWKFSIEDEKLIVQAMVIDADNFSREAPLSFAVSIPAFTHPNFDWTRWLLRQVLDIEEHEAREFFKIDGVKVFDPHG